MADKFGADTDSGIIGFTLEDAYESVRRGRSPVFTAPKNESRPSTISGPINAAKKCDPGITIFQ
jgi:hypothetical protein